MLIKNEIAQGNWENAYNYSTKLTSSNENFSNNVSQKISQEMQESYQKKQFEEQIQVKNKVIDSKNIWIYGLLTMVSFSLILFILFVFRRKQYNLRKDNIRNQKFTRQLIVEIEEERRRISADLHDSVNHDLLNIKNFGKKSSDEVIERLHEHSLDLAPNPEMDENGVLIGEGYEE